MMPLTTHWREQREIPSFAAAADDATAEKLFGALSDGGQVQMPMTKTFFASRFGMLADH